MPPIKKITKQQIIEKAFDLVQREGYELLTARRLAKELNFSTQPIYQTFADMKELRVELVKKAQEKMISSIMDKSDNSLPRGLAYILAYIQFAGEEKHLFQLIFASGDLNPGVIKELGVSDIPLDLNMIVYANGIIMMKAYNSLALSDEKLKEMLIHAYELFENNK